MTPWMLRCILWPAIHTKWARMVQSPWQAWVRGSSTKNFISVLFPDPAFPLIQNSCGPLRRSQRKNDSDASALIDDSANPSSAPSPDPFLTVQSSGSLSNAVSLLSLDVRHRLSPKIP